MKTTIFKQLILTIVVPVVVVLILLSGLNYHFTRDILVDSNNNKNKLISDEITHILEIQDIILEGIEQRLDKQICDISGKIVNDFFKNSSNIETVDLKALRTKLGMDSTMSDLYIIKSNGVIVNTTFAKDLNLNLFSFGEDHRKYLENILKGEVFVNERFAIENATKRLKKYTYQPTADHRYIVEIGVYSKEADNIMDFIKERINKSSGKQESIKSVDLFIGTDKPFSLNTGKKADSLETNILHQAIKEQLSKTVVKNIDGKRMHYEYIYLERKKSSLYKGSVVRIIADRSNEDRFLRNELLKSLLIFAITIIGVIFLIARNTKKITFPIEKLVENVTNITQSGSLSDRAEMIGNNEITHLSEHFNQMLDKLEEMYNDLERKVIERTAEIQQQKEEISAQRDALFEKNEILESAYSEIEKQKKHITDSIHYAERLQVAILSPESIVKKLLPDSFIFNQPKDIVSGDFYWVNEKDDIILFAVADCTGHGVPGAFMSIVGNNQLNNAVQEKDLTMPSDILNAVNNGVIKLLHKTTDTSEKSIIRDGMDIALCALDISRRKLFFAGAFNPVIIIRNHELTLIKGNKFPIGAYWDNQLKEFTLHELDIYENDCIYVFSDGYLDQFGGATGRKYMIKRFQELLLCVNHLPMNEQRLVLSKTINEWKGSRVQIDDILVLGVRVHL